jgi:hypothetical protein
VRAVALEALLGQRITAWGDALTLQGYELVTLRTSDANPGYFSLRARRSQRHDGPPATIDVRELWTPGADPDALTPSMHAHHLLRASWHAQIGGPGAECAERLDIDRNKPVAHVLHRHPHGAPNRVREATAIHTPHTWLALVESVIAHKLEDQED